MYMIMACILLHFYCVKYLMYMTVVIMIVVGNKLFEPKKTLERGKNPAKNTYADYPVKWQQYFNKQCNKPSCVICILQKDYT